MQKNILSFESFIRKSFVVLTIATFIVGGFFVFQTVLAAETLRVIPMSLTTGGSATAEWSTDNPSTGSHSVHLETTGIVGTGDEARIVIQAGDVGINTLNELETISWNAKGVVGYTPHVDVFLDNGKTLVFEYAKVDSSNCDNSGSYPTGEVNTFGDKGIVNNAAYAWLSSGPAGPCGDPTFDENHNSLTDWKTTDGTAGVLRFEIEVDNWISQSEAYVDIVAINGTTYYGLIQDAIGAAAAGDTVSVATGTYVENVTIPSGKDGLILVGESSADTIISVTNNSFGIKVESASVDISGFNIVDTNTGYSDCASNCGIWFAASGTSGDPTVIHDNKIEGFYTGIGGAGGVEYWNILNNEFNNNRTGIHFNTSDNMLVDGNTFSNYFAGVGGTEGTSNNSITDNTFLGSDGDLDSDLSGFIGSMEAIGMTDDAIDLLITGNSISGNNAFGIQVYSNGGSDTIDATIENNSITGTSDFGLNNNTSNLVIAESNWWGDASGPDGFGPGTGDSVSDNVDFDPWYIDEAMTTLSNAPDTTPNAFAFTDQTGVALSTVIESNIITVAGINAPAAISVTGGEYSIGIEAYTSADGEVEAGDTIRVRHTSSSSNSTAVNTVLTIGGVSDTFTSTTVAASGGGGGGGGGSTVTCAPGQTTFCQPASGQGQVLGASTGPIAGCDMRTTGFSTTTGQSCANNTPHSGQIPGCDTRTSGFSTTTGQSCVGNVPHSGQIPGCDMRTTGFSSVSGVSCANNVPHGQVLGETKFFFTLFLRAGPPYPFHLMTEVVELQKLLNARGYVCGPVDGKFGPLTRGCVVRFQIASALVGDGIVGPLTRAVLNR